MIKDQYSNLKFSEQYKIVPDYYSDITVESLAFSARTQKRLALKGVITVRDLLNTSELELSRISGFGYNCIQEIRNYISKFSTGKMSSLKCSKSSIPSVFFNYKDELLKGDFSIGNLDLNKEEQVFLNNLIEAYPDYQICSQGETLDNSRITSIISIASGINCDLKKYEELKKLYLAIPKNRLKNKAFGYIKAYTFDDEKINLLTSFFENEESTLGEIHLNKGIKNNLDFFAIKSFLAWCSFDLSLEIEAVFEAVYKKKKNADVVLDMRSKKYTLEQVGQKIGVTRERVRQIESSCRRLFSLFQSNVQILLKVAAENNESQIITPEMVADFCDAKYDELLYLLRGLNTSGIVYDADLDVFIIGDCSISGMLFDSIDAMPDQVKKTDISEFIKDISTEQGISPDIVEKAINEAYTVTGDIYHKSRLSLASMYDTVLRKYYPNGIHVYSDNELEGFKGNIQKEYGDVNLPRNNRAISARLSSIGILCNRGTYKAKQKQYIPMHLAEEIKTFIEQSNNTIFLISSLFHEFEDELRKFGVNNRFFMQGILHELFAEEYSFKRDYLSKDRNFNSFYSEIVRFIKESDYPVSKDEIRKAFSGITDVVISFATSDPDVLNFFGSYIHSSRIIISSTEKVYLRNTIEAIIADNNYHHGKELFDRVMASKPELLTRNSAFYPFCAFSIAENLFKEDYQFSRPYFAKKDVEINLPAERLRDLLDSSDGYSINELRDFCKDNHYLINSVIDYVNSLNDKFLLINNNDFISIERIGASKNTAIEIEKILLSELEGTIPINQLGCISQFPKLNVPWTDWLVYSVLFKWGSKVEVALSNKQFRSAVPLVSLNGEMDIERFKDLKPTSLIYTGIDDLDDLDNLIADYIEL